LRNGLHHYVGKFADMVVAGFVVFEQSGVGERAGFHAHGFVAGEIEGFEFVEFVCGDGTVEAERYRLGNGVARAAEDGVATGHGLDSGAGLRLQHERLMSAFDSGLCFGDLDFAGQIEVEQNGTHEGSLSHALPFSASPLRSLCLCVRLAFLLPACAFQGFAYRVRCYVYCFGNIFWTAR
jgi:hypothetical protein